MGSKYLLPVIWLRGHLSINRNLTQQGRKTLFLITTTKNVWNTGNGSITAGNWEATEQPKVTWLTNYSEGSDVR